MSQKDTKPKNQPSLFKEYEGWMGKVEVDLLEKLAHQKELVRRCIELLNNIEIAGRKNVFTPFMLLGGKHTQAVLFSNDIIVIVYAEGPLEIVFDLRCSNIVRAAVTNYLGALEEYLICDEPHFYSDEQSFYWGSEAIFRYAEQVRFEELLLNENSFNPLAH